MLFAIHMLDRADATDLRAQTAEAHKAFVGARLQDMYLGGPLLDDDGKTAIGSLIVMEFPDRAAAESFIAAEPYNSAGLFERVTVTCFAPVVTPGANGAG